MDLNTLTGRAFFPHLIAEPFRHGLAIAFGVSIAMLLIAAVASQLRGGRYVHEEEPDQPALGQPEVPDKAHASIGVAVAREAAALDGIPEQDVQFEKALAEQALAEQALAEKALAEKEPSGS